jgi:ribosome-associated protein
VPLITRTGGSILEPSELARTIVDLLADHQAEDIVMLDISRIASFADYFVIGSATSSRQMQALIDVLDRALGKEQIHPLRREGTADSGWVLLDFGQVIVHLFGPEQREYYDIERLWKDATPVVRIH